MAPTQSTIRAGVAATLAGAAFSEDILIERKVAAFEEMDKPVAEPEKKTAAKTFDPAKEVGVTPPLGFFDPLGFSKVGDEPGFRKLRSAEIKHGRVAMMAAVGGVVQHYWKFPGFEDVPSGLKAVLSGPGTVGFGALFIVSGVLELFFWKDDFESSEKEVGNFGNPIVFGAPLGWSRDMRDREINNGRAAMFAALGIVVAELVTGKDAVQQLGGGDAYGEGVNSLANLAAAAEAAAKAAEGATP